MSIGEEISSTGSGEDFFWQSERSFRVWRYGIGHSQLLLRAWEVKGNRRSAYFSRPSSS